MGASKRKLLTRGLWQSGEEQTARSRFFTPERQASQQRSSKFLQIYEEFMDGVHRAAAGRWERETKCRIQVLV